ncbi:carboxymuconolactone decarboxylase family protein [Chloroflexota bacterium]
MESKDSQLEFYDSITKYSNKRAQALPEVTAAQHALRDAVYKDGALSHKMKRLIAMAIAVSLGCRPCITGQTKMAVEAGATREEVLEAASVVLAMHGTSGYSESWRVVKILEELGKI